MITVIFFHTHRFTQREFQNSSGNIPSLAGATAVRRGEERRAEERNTKDGRFAPVKLGGL